MPNINDINNPLAAGFFLANSPNLKLREKIALAQMMQKRKYPTNLGEGLSAIGESLGDIGTARSLEAQDQAAQQAAARLGAPPTGTPTAEAAPGTMPPPAAAAVAPTSLAGGADPTSQAPAPSFVQEGGPPKGMTMRPGINMPPPMQAAAPAVPTPPDQQQSYEPGAPVRMSTPAQIADFRGQNPLPPNIPPPPGQQPQPPGWTTDKQFNAIDAAATPPVPPRPSVADYGQKLALAPTPPPDAPALAAAPPGSDDPRRAIALAMLKQGQMGQPQSSAFAPAAPPVPMPPPAPPPNQDIAAAPPATPPIRSMPPPQAAPEQPGAVAGYVPPPLADPTKATVIPPSKRERELQVILNANQGNPYASGSPAALELQDLQNERAKQQALEDKKTEAAIARTTKREELRQQGLMDQDKRLWESRRSGIEVGDLQGKLQQEAERRRVEIQKGQQELVTPAGTAPPQPNLLGTPQSPQRSGIPTTPPVPPGITPQKWAELHAPEHQKALATVESAAPDVAESLSLLNKIREHPAREMGVGAFNKLYAGTPQGAGFKALMDQLGGKNFLIGYQKLRGGGAISEIEGQKTEQAQARLTTAQDKTDFDNALNDLESNLRNGLERAQRKVNQPVTAYQNTPNDPVAPDIGQVGTRGGKTVEYIGGDPSKDSSYRTPRR